MKLAFFPRPLKKTSIHGQAIIRRRKLHDGNPIHGGGIDRSALLLLLLIFLSAAATGSQRETGFLNRTLRQNSDSFRYQVYVPPQWTPENPWPVILFLHGAGERGEDGVIQSETGIGTAIRRNPERFPCLVVLPQCREDMWWVHAEMESVALKALREVIREFNGDPQRIYLTGLSMGGYGTWRLGAKYPGTFAALVPICGGIRPPPRIRLPRGSSLAPPPGDPYVATAQKIGKTPVWAFHGDADPTVPVSESRNMVEALQAAGGNVTYTEYEGVGHNSWDKAYAEPELIPWLLSHRLR